MITGTGHASVFLIRSNRNSRSAFPLNISFPRPPAPDTRPALDIQVVRPITKSRNSCFTTLHTARAHIFQAKQKQRPSFFFLSYSFFFSPNATPAIKPPQPQFTAHLKCWIWLMDRNRRTRDSVRIFVVSHFLRNVATFSTWNDKSATFLQPR